METCDWCNDEVVKTSDGNVIRCRTCRKNEDWRRSTGEVLDTPCRDCKVIRRLYLGGDPLDDNYGKCLDCLWDAGRKICVRCELAKFRPGNGQRETPEFLPERATCRDCLTPLWRLTREQRALHMVLKRLYGVSYEEFERRSKEQGELCLICRQKPRRRLSVDHDHKTLEVRGLLCEACNLGLGHFKDDPTLLRAAAAYLEARASSAPQAPALPLPAA